MGFRLSLLRRPISQNSILTFVTRFARWKTLASCVNIFRLTIESHRNTSEHVGTGKRRKMKQLKKMDTCCNVIPQRNLLLVFGQARKCNMTLLSQPGFLQHTWHIPRSQRHSLHIRVSWKNQRFCTSILIINMINRCNLQQFLEKTFIIIFKMADLEKF